MDLLTLLSVCSLGFDPKLMQGVAIVQSEATPYAYKMGAEVTKFDDLQEAISSARASQERGEKVRIGLMGLDVDLLAATAQPNEAMFEPCVNVNIASRALMKLEERCERAGKTDPKSCAIMSYMGEGYEKQDQTHLDFIMISAITGSLPNPEIKGVISSPKTRPAKRNIPVNTGSIFFEDKDENHEKEKGRNKDNGSLFFD